MDSNAPLSQADCLITTTAIARLSLLLLLLLQEKIYRIQMANYNKGLGKLANISAEEAYANGFTKRTADKHRADSQKAYRNSVGSLTPEERQALSKYYCPPPTISKNGLHDLAIDDVVVQANCVLALTMRRLELNSTISRLDPIPFAFLHLAVMESNVNF